MKSAALIQETPSVQSHPDYRAVQDKLQARRADLTAIEREIEQFHHQNQTRVRRDAISTRAEMLARGASIEDALEQPVKSDPGLEQLYERHAIIKKAVDILEGQVTEEASRLSKGIIATAKPRHQALVRRCAETLAAFATALQEESEYRERLIREGVKLGELTPMPFYPEIGRLGDDFSSAASYLMEAKTCGAINQREYDTLRRGESL